jgi:hypothetical protein
MIYCGFAAAQCGKAQPFRRVMIVVLRLCLRFDVRGVAYSPLERSFTERHSLSALDGGRAAKLGDVADS